MKITQDDFVWKILTKNQAKFIFISGIFDLYLLFDDESDTLVESIEEIDTAAKNGLQLAIEVGFYEK
jgi:hypothetical protein